VNPAPRSQYSFLETIVEQKRIEVEQARRTIPEEVLRGRLREVGPARPFASIFDQGFACIAEIKKASPSRGLFTENFFPERIAREYERGGAAAISVLTDEEFFGGSKGDLRRVREATSLPILRKEFIIDEYQVLESRLLNADAILLISEILSVEALRQFIGLAKQLGMAALVEGHSAGGIRKAVDAGAEIIGVNNRDLNTFTLDHGASFRLKPLIPESCIAISESGIKTTSDLLKLRAAGFRGALIGEALMLMKNREQGLRDLLAPLR